MKKPCTFCQIVQGEISSFKIFEDETVFAFLDHRPLIKGHTLIVPKQHFPFFTELPISTMKNLFYWAKIISKVMENPFGADGSFVAVNTKISQSVLHVHVHVVPRYHKDGLFSPKLLWKRKSYESENEQKSIQTILQKGIIEV